MPSRRTSTLSNKASRAAKRRFDLERANRAIVYVSRVVEDITGCYRRALAVRERIEAPGPSIAIEPLKREYEGLMDRLNELIDELHLVGVELKDFEKGIIEFPARHGGRDIYLCWRRGEEAVGSWHDGTAGYNIRYDLAALDSPRPGGKRKVGGR